MIRIGDAVTPPSDAHAIPHVVEYLSHFGNGVRLLGAAALQA